MSAERSAWVGRWVTELRATFDAVLNAIFPPQCAAAHGVALVTRSRYGVCEACLAAMPRHLGARCVACDLPSPRSPCARCVVAPPSFVRLRAPFVYDGVIAELVAAAKFRGREDVAEGLGRLLADDPEARRACEGVSCIVPVPLGPKRRRERGYNQSAVLARALGRATGVPVAYALERTRDTLAQSELGLADRRGNVAGAFAARRAPGDVVVLVDDVVTSGATAHAASMALREAGVREVRVVALARSL